MLPALDNFDLAKTNLKAEIGGGGEDHGPVPGFGGRALMTILGQGLVAVDGVGTPFDPNFHEAIMREESDEPEDVIIEEFRKGYKMGEDTLVRASMVKVSAGPAGGVNAFRDARRAGVFCLRSASASCHRSSIRVTALPYVSPLFPSLHRASRSAADRALFAALIPASLPLVQAHRKLKPPMRPKTSHTSPQKNTEGAALDSIVEQSTSSSATPPPVTSALRYPWCPLTSISYFVKTSSNPQTVGFLQVGDFASPGSPRRRSSAPPRVAAGALRGRASRPAPCPGAP